MEVTVQRGMKMKLNRERTVLMFFDILFINLTLWLSFTVRFEGSIPLVYRSNWLYYAVLVTSLRMVCFYVFGLYNSLWGYSSLPEMIQIIKAITASSVLIYLVDQVIFNPSPPIPKSIHFISLVINLFMVGGSRLAIRLRQEMLNIFENRKKQRRRVLVIGAG